MLNFKNYIIENATAGLKKKAEKSGMPIGILRKVYNRGVAAWKTGHRPGTTPQQWGFARVNSFVTKSSGTWGKADKDLASKVRESVEDECACGEQCTCGKKEVNEIQINWNHKVQKHATIKHSDGSHWGVFDDKHNGTAGHEIRKIKTADGTKLNAKDSRKASSNGYKMGMGKPKDAAAAWARKHGGTVTHHKVKF